MFTQTSPVLPFFFFRRARATFLRSFVARVARYVLLTPYIHNDDDNEEEEEEDDEDMSE